MKTKLLFFIYLVFLSSFIYSQTVQDTSAVTIETRSGGKYSGHIISETKDTIKIETINMGIVSIATTEIVYHNLINIETKDGNEFLGEIIEEDPLYIKLKTQKFGEVTISKSDIKSQKPVEVQQVKEGKYWFPNPQSTRYFWAPNGYGLEKGEGYYQNIWVLWNQFAVGLTNSFSVGGGIVPLFLFGGGPTPVFGTVKFSVPVTKNKFNIGAGAIAGTVLGEENTGFGILYGLTTFGSSDKNMTFGAGAMFASGDWATAPLFNLNGMFRVSNKGYVLTENYLITSGGETIVLISMGGRSIIKKAALDYGLFIPFYSEMESFIAIPWLGFTIPFGKTE